MKAILWAARLRLLAGSERIPADIALELRLLADEMVAAR
jgi:hypothetical protein